MQNRTNNKFDLKNWEIVREGSVFRFYNKNVKYCHRDKYPWLIGEFTISLDPTQNNRATIFVNKMVSDAFPKIYFADREYLDRQRSDKNNVEKDRHETSKTFFTSPYSRDYQRNELYKIGCNTYADRLFMSCAEMGLYAHARCNDYDSYAAFAKDGLSILALVDSSLYEAISVIQSEIDSMSLETATQLKVSNKFI